MPPAGVERQNPNDEQVCFAVETPQSGYRTYPIRWIVVLMFAFINGSNGFLWISYAPVADLFVDYYQTKESVLNWMLLIFPLTTVVFGLPAALIADWLGIRVVLLATSSWNLICGILRTLGSANLFTSPTNSLPFLAVGYLIAGLGQPLCMFSSTKLAMDWFPDKQRTTANNIASLGNSLGVLLGSLLAPLCIRKPADIPVYDYATLGVVAFGFLLTLILIRRSKPVTPPSAAAAILASMSRGHHDQNISCGGKILHRLSVFKGHLVALLKCLSIGSCILLIMFSTGLAYFTALSSLFQQILSAKDYSNQFAGLCGALLIGGGLCASIVAAYIVDRTGRLIESTKICFALAVLCADGLATVIWFSGQQGLIAFFTLALGGFGFSQYSMSLELAAEATFPIPETITSGLLIIGSQLLAVLFVLVLQAVAPCIPSPGSAVCDSTSKKDYSHPNLVICGLMTLLAVVQLFAMRLPYKRREASEAAHLDIKPDTTIQVSATTIAAASGEPEFESC